MSSATPSAPAWPRPARRCARSKPGWATPTPARPRSTPTTHPTPPAKPARRPTLVDVRRRPHRPAALHPRRPPRPLPPLGPRALGGEPASMTAGARQLARIAVDDETWRRFRQVAIIRHVSIAEYLGRL